MVQRVRAAGVLVEGGKILLVTETTVSGEPDLIPPGGGLEAQDASLAACVRREFWEETGVWVVAREVMYVREFLSLGTGTLHVEVFFRVERDPDAGADAGSPDRPWGWYSREELAGKMVFPAELKDRPWAAGVSAVYLGRSEA